MASKEQISVAQKSRAAVFAKSLSLSVREFHIFFGDESPLAELFGDKPDRELIKISLDIRDDIWMYRVVWAGEGFENAPFRVDTPIKRFTAERFNKLIFNTSEINKRASISFMGGIVIDPV